MRLPTEEPHFLEHGIDFSTDGEQIARLMAIPVPRRKSPNHVRKFDGGRRTPQEYHAEYGFPPSAKCAACGKRPSVRGIVLAPFDEACKRGMLPPSIVDPTAAMQALVMVKSGTEYTPHLRISTAYACSSCRGAFERVLAKAPSWCVVEVNRGPDPNNRILA